MKKVRTSSCGYVRPTKYQKSYLEQSSSEDDDASADEEAIVSEPPDDSHDNHGKLKPLPCLN